MKPLASLAETVAALEANHRLEQTLRLRVGDCLIEVRTNSLRLIEGFRDYFGEFLSISEQPANMVIRALQTEPPDIDVPLTIKQPDPGKTKIKEEYFDFPDGRLVRKRLTGMLFFFGRGVNLAIGDCESNDNQVINFINNRFIQQCLNNGHLLGHAAAVCLHNTGLALAGFSGKGKSTFALSLMNRGCDFVSNDRLLVRRDAGGLRMCGVPKQPRVNPGTILNNAALGGLIDDNERNRLASMSTEQLWELEDKYDAPIHRVYGAGRFRTTAPMVALAILNWDLVDRPPQISAVDIRQRTDLLSAFIKSPGLFYEPDDLDPERAFSEEAYIEALRHCAVFEVTGGIDFDALADTFSAYLKTDRLLGE